MGQCWSDQGCKQGHHRMVPEAMPELEGGPGDAGGLSARCDPSKAVAPPGVATESCVSMLILAT